MGVVGAVIVLAPFVHRRGELCSPVDREIGLIADAVRLHDDSLPPLGKVSSQFRLKTELR